MHHAPALPIADRIRLACARAHLAALGLSHRRSACALLAIARQRREHQTTAAAVLAQPEADPLIVTRPGVRLTLTRQRLLRPPLVIETGASATRALALIDLRVQFLVTTGAAYRPRRGDVLDARDVS